jgi:Uma2 family endonuclease
VPFETFLDDFPGEHLEWYNGYVIKIAGIDERHDASTAFFSILLTFYLEATGGGRVLRDPMIMRPSPDLPARAPDLQLLLPAKLNLLQRNRVVGAPDLVIEVISPESQRRDRVEKYAEYERPGIQEYWLFDPRFEEALFHQLDAAGKYQRAELDEYGNYHSKVLEHISLPVERLWQDTLPSVREVITMVEAMLAAE